MSFGFKALRWLGWIIFFDLIQYHIAARSKILWLKGYEESQISMWQVRVYTSKSQAYFTMWIDTVDILKYLKLCPNSLGKVIS